jgi:hypothetical protein
MTGFSLDNLGNSFIEYDESIRGGLRSWMRRGVPEIFRYCETYLATARCQRVLGSAAVFSNQFAVLPALKSSVAARKAPRHSCRGSWRDQRRTLRMCNRNWKSLGASSMASCLNKESFLTVCGSISRLIQCSKIFSTFRPKAWLRHLIRKSTISYQINKSVFSN